VNELILFGSSFALVFLLGLQSLTVNGGHTHAAFLNSMLIGCANLVVLKYGVSSTGTEIAAYIAGGPFGIISSMRFFRWYRGRNKKTGP
jgi:hypothetical protein